MPDTVMSNMETPQPMATGYQRRSVEFDKLAAAIAKAQGAMENAEKGAENLAFKRDGKPSTYATLGNVWDAIRKPLADNGLSVMQWPRTVDKGVEIETELLHESGQFMRDTLWLPCPTMTVHTIGSTITYGRRYALMSIVGIAPEDDDGNAAVDGHKPGAPGTAGAGSQFRPERRRNPGTAQTESLRVDPVDRDMVQGDGRSQYEADKAKKAAAPINTPAAAGNAVKRLEWVKASRAYLADKDEHVARDWWIENKDRIDVIETALPRAFEELLDAYNQALERKVPA